MSNLPVPDSSEHEQTTSVEVPTAITDRIARRIVGTDFESVDTYVTIVLHALLEEIEDHSFDTDGEQDDSPNSEMVGSSAVEDRLESLGYL